PRSPSEQSLTQRASLVNFPKVSGWSEETSGMVLAQRANSRPTSSPASGFLKTHQSWRKD
ncbi:hypothetical protein A2U01_0087576, partial [Trifolium medium]|nr:hypothetical protein [Trifolium medium]